MFEGLGKWLIASAVLAPIGVLAIIIGIIHVVIWLINHVQIIIK